MKLGISPINWCNDDDPSLGKDITFQQCIQEMSLAGYEATELGNKFPRNPLLLKQSLDEKGLQMSSAWFSTYFTEPEKYDLTLERFMEHLSFLRALGANFINVCECGHSIQGSELAILGPDKPRFTDEQWDNLIQGLHILGRIAHDYQMQIVYHYHAGTGVFTEDEIDFLMAHTSKDLVYLLLDTGHAAFAGISPLHLIHKYQQRIRYVHLKDIRQDVLDNTFAKNHHFMKAICEGVFTVPGDGCIDFPGVIKGLREMNYQGWMIVEAEQDPIKAPPLAYARKAYDYLKTI